MSKTISREDLLEAIDELADEVDGTPTRSQMDADGRYASNLYYQHFENWNDALREAGYEPNHTGNTQSSITKADLLDELQRLAAELERTPRRKDMNSDAGNYSSQPYYNHFDGWNDALEQAGLGTNHEYVSDEELIRELQRAADAFGRSPTFEEFDEWSDHAPSTYAKRFGSWLEAREQAGLEGDETRHGARYDRDELLEHLRDLGDRLGRPPTKKEIGELDGPSTQPYYRVFGTVRNGLEAAGFELHESDREWPDDYPDDWLDRREEVRERDGYQCVDCRMDNDEHNEVYGQDLHVHHIPDAGGDPDALENLVTLCNACHKKWDRTSNDPRGQ
ncbi:homing endonuclease associated repeat-containing protein [Halobiforma nitratireducens]|uniref:homing endonuclease associated repeat-containing protein n=1 Tax=Halobiforma nitratireducens TaxID=130048 RepID=UPI00126943C0|nr:HNH endonuclease [Halobiforma nitratireducens]